MLNKNRTLIKTSILFLFLFIALIFVGCGNEKLIKSINGVEVEVACLNIHSKDQDSYLDNSYDSITSYAKGTEEASRPYCVKLSWKKSKNASEYSVVICEDYKEECITINTTKTEIEVYNLKIRTVYNYKVYDSTDINTANVIKNDYFYINEKCIRNIYVDGVTNVRDVGGWETSYGSRNKQGLIYRSGKFNKDESTELVITQKGIDTLVNDLKIKTELDFRTVSDNENGGITTSSLGASVEYISFPMESNGNVMLLNKKKLADLFTILADETKYPMIMHCSIGTDRTGFVAFLINALCGVSDEDLYRDYLFSNFGEIGSPRTVNTMQKNYFNYLEPYEGNNIKEKLITFLVKEGVSEDDINSVINIMKGE